MKPIKIFFLIMLVALSASAQRRELKWADAMKTGTPSTFAGWNGAGTAAEITATAATATLNTFTSGLKGLVPASGGGTANFLRADGTWAAAGSAVGSDGSVQIALSGVLSSTTAINVINVNNSDEYIAVANKVSIQSDQGSKFFDLEPRLETFTGTGGGAYSETFNQYTIANNEVHLIRAIVIAKSADNLQSYYNEIIFQVRRVAGVNTVDYTSVPAAQGNYSNLKIIIEASGTTLRIFLDNNAGAGAVKQGTLVAYFQHLIL
jgi:hypothetical protein